MKPHDEPHGLCSVDPITLTGLAVGALGGLGASAASGAFSGSGASSAPAPSAPAAPAATPAPPATSPMGTKGAPKSQQPTFIGAASTPPTQSGQKTLLGQ